MNLQTIHYSAYEHGLPQSGRHILAQERSGSVIVYQAFNPQISDYALAHQQFGGAHYKFTRMSWIKPNFLWMMYRAGWAEKVDQERILAIEIEKSRFMEMLKKAVHSSFKHNLYPDRETWKQRLATSNVRLQWDPDHDPHGKKLDRRAIQLGLRGSILRDFATEWIVSITDITPFVNDQKQKLDAGMLDELMVMEERPLVIEDEEIRRRIGLV